MTDDDLMDFLHDTSWTVKIIAKHFKRTEHHTRIRLRNLVDQGLVEADRSGPLSTGMMGAPQTKYRLARTRKTA